MAQATDWDYYSENADGSRNVEGSRFTARPKSNELWRLLLGSLDDDAEVVAVGYEKADKVNITSGQQGTRVSKVN